MAPNKVQAVYSLPGINQREQAAWASLRPRPKCIRCNTKSNRANCHSTNIQLL